LAAAGPAERETRWVPQRAAARHRRGLDHAPAGEPRQRYVRDQLRLRARRRAGGRGRALLAEDDREVERRIGAPEPARGQVEDRLPRPVLLERATEELLERDRPQLHGRAG